MEKDKEEIIDPVVDDNTVVDDEVVDTMPDETLAQTDEVIPAPVDPVLPEIPIDTIPASTSEPLLNQLIFLWKNLFEENVQTVKVKDVLYVMVILSQISLEQCRKL